MAEKAKKPQRIAAEKRKEMSIHERQNKALELWLVKKKSYREIEKILGISSSQVGIDVNAAFTRAAEKLTNELTVNVRREFHDQLKFAKKLRMAAEEYLSDPDDPLKLVIMPRADEIEVVYYDNCDMTGGDNPQPKKKKGNLQSLLAMLAGPGEIQDEWARDTAQKKLTDIGDPDEMFNATWEAARNYFVGERQSIDRDADKVTIKHIDLRKFALDAINTTDTCIDKFAKLGGDYTKDKNNPADSLAIARQVIEDAVAKGMERAEAVKRASERYGILEETLLDA